MNQPRPAPRREPSWDLYWALREQWTHEDELIHYRSIWLILSQSLLLTAYGTLLGTNFHWVAYGLPLLGIAVAVLIALSINAGIAATETIQQRFEMAGLNALCNLIPDWRYRIGGLRSTRVLPYIFGAIWLLALAAATRTSYGYG